VAMKYIKQLDTIRGIGILIVILFHWLPVDTIYNTYPNRPFGVDVFFVLSGFLITNILLGAKIEAEEASIPKKHVFISFYFKRARRIFPVYYLAILIIVVVHQSLDASLRSELFYALTFTLNLHFYNQQYWGDLTTHLWTMAVEEQFYLVWPWMILLVNKRYLPHVIIGFITIGFVTQCLITDKEFGYLPAYTCFDSFGIGALISWITIYKTEYLEKTFRTLQFVGIISFAALIVGAIFPDWIFLAPQRTLRSLVSAWAITYVIWKSYRNEASDLPVFNNKILMFIGKISYGMYIYHIFFPWLYFKFNHHINQFIPSTLNDYIFHITLIENFAMLVLLSWLSWRFIERPILQWGKNIGGQNEPSQQLAGVHVAVNKNIIYRMLARVKRQLPWGLKF
jgi:peptidoglycan/LPS O-acetylase OafA/YrhL